MDRARAVEAAARVAAAFPRFPTTDATLEWWAGEFQRESVEVVSDAVERLVRHSEHAPSLAVVRSAIRSAKGIHPDIGELRPRLPAPPGEPMPPQVAERMRKLRGSLG